MRYLTPHPRDQTMAVKLKDSLQDILSDFVVNKRVVIWLRYFINSQLPNQAITCELNAPGIRDQIAQTLKNNPQTTNTIKAVKKSLLFPEIDLEWITEDNRQNHYIQTLIFLLTNHTLYDEGNITCREKTIATIDTLQQMQANHSKLDLINLIKTQWELTKMTDKAFEWFDGVDEEQKTKTAWQIIGKKHPEIASQYYPPKTKNELLIVLDFSIATHPEKIILIESVKKRWSQNKYRANQNGKNQYNFILSDKAIYRLDKLAKKHEIKRTEVLEILLKMESENGEYISKHLNRLGDL